MKTTPLYLSTIFMVILMTAWVLSGCKKEDNTNPENKIDLGSVTTENWMASIHDSTSMGALTIPGTHISGADVNHLSGTELNDYTTQQFTIGDQLNMGVRFLDLRVGFDESLNSGGLSLYTDEIRDLYMNPDVYLNQSFRTVLEGIKGFLDVYQTETVILLIRQVHSQFNPVEFWQWVAADLDYAGIATDRIINYNPHTDAALPLISACRNKILLISSDSGTWLYPKTTLTWPANTTKYQGTEGNLGYWVQDAAEWNCIDFPEKITYIENLIGDCRSQSPSGYGKSLYINFLSAWDICDTPEGISTEINDNIFGFMQREMTDNRPCGILVMDFAGSNQPSVLPLLNLLIAINSIK